MKDLSQDRWGTGCSPWWSRSTGTAGCWTTGRSSHQPRCSLIKKDIYSFSNLYPSVSYPFTIQYPLSILSRFSAKVHMIIYIITLRTGFLPYLSIATAPTSPPTTCTSKVEKSHRCDHADTDVTCCYIYDRSK